MTKDNFYLAVESIYKEQGYEEAMNFLSRRGYSITDADAYMSQLVINQTDPLANMPQEEESINQPEAKELGEPPKQPSFFSRLFKPLK
jgi:hypothetical protein